MLTQQGWPLLQQDTCGLNGGRCLPGSPHGQPAAAWFWDLLTDFCGLGLAPPAWKHGLCNRPYVVWQGLWMVVRRLP